MWPHTHYYHCKIRDREAQRYRGVIRNKSRTVYVWNTREYCRDAWEKCRCQVCTYRKSQSRNSRQHKGMRRMWEDGFPMGAPAPMSDVRSCRLLWRFYQQARNKTFQKDKSSSNEVIRAWWKLEMVLCRRIDYGIKKGHAAKKDDWDRESKNNFWLINCLNMRD
jgi:hypothetical protein